MDCKGLQNLIQVYLDGELDAVMSLEIEAHLRDCSDCRQLADRHRALSEAVRSRAPYYSSPAHLRSKIERSMREAEYGKRGFHIPFRNWAAMAAAMSVVAIVTWSLTYSVLNPKGEGPLAQAIVASHISSLMANHLTDITSSDQHTVKPWFNGKLDYSPQVKDLSSSGFTLLGGRLDYLDQRVVAVLAYGHLKHYVNVFIFPSKTDRDASPEMLSLRGYNIIHWQSSGMSYWAISDMDQHALAKITALSFE